MKTLVLNRWICNPIFGKQAAVRRASLRGETDGDEGVDDEWPDSDLAEDINNGKEYLTGSMTDDRFKHMQYGDACENVEALLLHSTLKEVRYQDWREAVHR